MNPKVSVIVPVYNTEKYIRECLDSIVNQTLKDIEIIIINDKSPDNSLSIINEYQKQDERIVLIDKKVNEGVGKARNDGIKVAHGDFVIFMDSDDLYSNDTALEHLYNAAVENNVKVSAGRRESLTEEGKIELFNNPLIEYDLSFGQEGLMNYKDFQYDYGYQCYLINRRMLKENNILFPLYSRFQDPPFFVKTMYAANEYFFIDESVYRYRLLPSSSKISMKKTLDMLDGIVDNICFAKENGLVKLYYLTALRMKNEVSYMAIHNLFDDADNELLYKLIRANSLVDVEWIKHNGYDIDEPFVLDVFKYAVETAGKYEELRKKKILKPIRILFRN